jgi:drug/metabolite transporter (DMT)-like permease
MELRLQVFVFTALAMLAFAGNSILCRLAFRTTGIDAASFTAIRISAGAFALWLIMAGRASSGTGSWTSATALFVYAACFSFAYVNLPAATGALILFGAVQFTMLAYGLARGDRLAASQVAGIVLAACGLIALLLPGFSAPSFSGAAMMMAAGIAWGVYSLRGRAAGNPARETAGNFMRAVPFALVLAAFMFAQLVVDAAGAAYAIASGALTSAAGYVIWYTAVKHLKATTAASVQLSVPALAALGGIAFLNEPVTWRLAICCAAILGGVALATFGQKTSR